MEPSNDSKKASAADQADTETAADGPVEEAAEEVVAEPAEEEAVVEEESLADVVDALNEKDVHIVDENGEPVAMASVEAEEMLQSKDPFFWLPDDLNFPDGPGKWVGYTSTGTGCPVNVECNISATPFKQAVSEAPNGSMIYVAQGHYAENVVVDNANLNLSRNLSFTAFSSIAVSASSPIPTNIIGANATVDQITLNVNFDTTYGVYANLVTVNDEGGLDDAMQLVSYDGRIEAEMYIYGPVDSPRVRDENNTVDFELECGEPDDTIIINRKYRMTLMRPYDPDIVAFYETQVDDGRTTPISSLGRIEDLRIAVNVSEDNKTKTADPPHFFGEWYDEDEKQIYWYLLGNTEFNTTNSDIQNFSDRQKEMADEIAYTTDWDDVTRYWDVWFMNPPTNNNNKAIGNKQLTFFVYDPRDFGRDGCMDEEALNYDPYATYQDLAICEYPIDPPTTTTTTTPGDPVFVAAVDEVLIPVTGADLGMQAIVPASGLLLVGISFLMKGWMDNKKK